MAAPDLWRRRRGARAACSGSGAQSLRPVLIFGIVIGSVFSGSLAVVGASWPGLGRLCTAVATRDVFLVTDARSPAPS
jgi:hypothetical protein